MIVLVDADSLPWMISHFGIKENLVELDDFKRKLDSYVLNILSSVNSQEYIMYLSGKDNFRKTIQANKLYKGNRGKGEKPLYFDELRQYLIDVYHANVCNGCEADDYLCMSQIYFIAEINKYISSADLNYPVPVIASLDKDMQQIPGYHLNIKTMVVTEVSEEQATRTFWLQVLTGDTTDSVTGLEGCGTKCAENLLNEAKQERYPEIVFQAFKNKYGDDEGIRLFKANYMLIKLMTSNVNFKLPKIENVDEVIEKLNGIHKDT